MRIISLSLLLSVLACAEREPRKAVAAGALPRLRVAKAPAGSKIVVDGKAADGVWKAAVETVIPLDGGGPGEVRLRGVHDGKRLYLLAVWKDPAKSYNRFWRRTGVVEFEKHATEDGFAICWAPNSLAKGFREQGCAMFCHDGRHVYPPDDRAGLIDFSYWGAQQHARYRQARDMWLRFGDAHRLRGDSQPEESDNLPNLSVEYDGPRYYPMRLSSGFARILDRNNVQRVTKKILTTRIAGEHNFGREIPLDIQQARKGSRGDVAAYGTHYEGKSWVLELARDLVTGERDDLPLDPGAMVSYLFAVAIYDDAAGADHTAQSGAIELHFVQPPVGIPDKRPN